jgi:hypothetical protein
MWRYAIGICLIMLAASRVRADDSTSDPTAVQSLFNTDPPQIQQSTDTKKEVPRVPEQPGNAPSLPSQHFAVGVNYTGGQFRYRFAQKWAAESRMQIGSADSDIGTIRAFVFGLRAYRFFPFGKSDRIAWYLAGEGDYARASSHEYNYQVSGLAFGSVGGLEYRLTRRISLAADIGPYVISLKEQQTGISSTGLDFVVNTALIFYLF